MDLAQAPLQVLPRRGRADLGAEVRRGFGDRTVTLTHSSQKKTHLLLRKIISPSHLPLLKSTIIMNIAKTIAGIYSRYINVIFHCVAMHSLTLHELLHGQGITSLQHGKGFTFLPTHPITPWHGETPSGTLRLDSRPLRPLLLQRVERAGAGKVREDEGLHGPALFLSLPGTERSVGTEITAR